nr:MAG TPA: hypothetical protein [Caudoviricetes sp.]
MGFMIREHLSEMVDAFLMRNFGRIEENGNFTIYF